MGVKKKTNSQGIRLQTKLPQSKFGAFPPAIQGLKADSTEYADTHRPVLRELVWQVVAMIPPGKVASYGQIAKLTGFPNHSRYVGTTLRNLPKGSKLPWFRVVNAHLRISQRGGGEQRQRRLLELDGVEFIGERIAKQHRWETS